MTTAQHKSQGYKHVAPLSGYMREVMKAVDEAEWMGDFDTADTLRNELQSLKDLEDKGELYVTHFQSSVYGYSRCYSYGCRLGVPVMVDPDEDKQDREDDPCDDWSDRPIPKPSTDSAECTA